MESITVRDLCECTGELIRHAEAGEVSVITRRGVPIFVAVPFDENLREQIGVAIAMRLFRQEDVSLSGAARIAGCSVGEMTDLLREQCIPMIRTPPAQLEQKLADFD